MYAEGVVTDGTCQKWFVKFCAGDVLLDDAPPSGRPVEVDSDQIESLRTTLYHAGDSRHTHNIQISKANGENEKNGCYFMEKLNGLFGQPKSIIYSC